MRLTPILGKYDNIMETIANETPSTPIQNNATKDSIYEYWKENEGIFNTTYENKLKHIHDSTEKAVSKITQAQQKMEMEIRSYYDKLTTEFQDHKDTIEDIKTQTIDSCFNSIDTR